MPKLHYFYPENDLALAAGISRYTAPAPALRLSNAGRLLPLWYGAPGDKVLCYGVNDKWLSRMQRDFNLATDITDHQYKPELEAAPWGWSLASRQAYADEGFTAESLPSDKEIEMLRNLSHRRTAAKIAAAIRPALAGIELPAPAIEARTIEEAQCAIKDFGDAAVVKLPWSSSGRGVANSLITGTDRTLAMAANGIHTQGSVMIEPAMDKDIDFAALYECHGGRCRFAGTSVFEADARGHYAGNLLAPEPVRISRIAHLYPIDRLSDIIEKVRDAIEKIVAPHYSGPLGMDMLIDKQGRIHPTVELNLRMTMGHVANKFADMHLAEGLTGRFAVVPLKNSSPADAYTTADGKLASGTLLLTPQNPHFAFMVQASGAER